MDKTTAIKPAKIAASLIIVLLIAISFGGTADRVGQEYTETGFQRALVTFATARIINGIISAIQGTEVAIQPAGIGAVLTPGEILDPINDLVEQFSQVMLFSAAVLGTQKLLIEFSGWVWFSVVLSAALLVWLITLWLPHIVSVKVRKAILALAGVLLLIRFVVPTAAIVNEAIFDSFLAPRYEAASQHLQTATIELESQKTIIASPQEPPENDRSVFDKIEKWLDSTKEKLQVGKRIDQLTKAADDIAEEIITLIVLFMVQTLLLPLLFAWLSYVAAKQLFRYSLGDRL